VPEDDLFQATLWELPPGSPTHFFYVFTNLSSYKAGHSKDTTKRRKGDQQYKGTVLVGRTPCNCPLEVLGGRPMCRLEQNWAHTHRRARLPFSEWYRATDGVQAALRFRFSTDDRAMAIIDQVERNNRRQSA